MKTIITIQHTQSIHHTNGMVGSWTDWNLSELGKIQAGNIGRKLSRELRDKNFVMYSSDLARARQTAEIVGKQLGITPILRRDLRESRRDVWNRLDPFFKEIFSNKEENLMIVSHGDLLSIFNAMWLGLRVESLNEFEIYGLAGGVSYMFQNDDGKRFVKRISDMSYCLD